MPRALLRILATALAVYGGTSFARAQGLSQPADHAGRALAAGGGNDVMARIVADKMSKTLGQQVVIENRAGAGGSTATRAVAKAAPDGYTLVIGGTGTLAVNPTLYQNVGYDPRKDFAPVGLIGTSALVVLVIPSLPAHNIARADRARQEGAGQAQLCVGRRRQRHPSRHRAVRADGRHQAHPRALSRHRAGAHRSDRRPCRDLFLRRCRPAIGLVEDGKVRALAVTGSSAPPCSRICRRWRKRRCPASTRCCTTASWRRPARRSRSSTSSTRRCARRCRARHQGAHGQGRHRAAALDAGGIRRRHRPRGDQMVGGGEAVGAKGE